MTAIELVKALGGRWHSHYGMARCPVHEDRTPSLSVTESPDRKVLIKCFAGCEQQRVIQALRGLELWPGRAGGVPTLSEAERENRRRQSIERERDFQRRGAFVDRICRQTWDRAAPARGSPIENWIRARGICLDPAALDLPVTRGSGGG